MKNMTAIVTTTINAPTEAFFSFLKRRNWTFIVVGDKKTPEDEYLRMNELKSVYPNFVYLDCKTQEKFYPELSSVLGWNTIQRRNIGFVHAYNMGAEVIVTIDDDNIPYDSWGNNYVNKIKNNVDYWRCNCEVFDPLSITEYNHLWHRGFPIQLVPNKNDVTYAGKRITKPYVQADLWDGDPDIDSFVRITQNPCVKFNTITNVYRSNKLTVFNSQNTFLSRECFPYYCVMPFVGRMDDIFGSYHLQIMKPEIEVIFGPASVYQRRNVHNLTKDLENEYIGYVNGLEFINILKRTQSLKDCSSIIPKETIEFYEIYTEQFLT